jgi:Tropinone reductase 1
MPSNTWELTGKKALITGATQGIGLAIAQCYLQKGAEVFITARTAETIDALISGWRESGYQAYGAPCDMADPVQRVRLIDSLQETWPHLDILVNNVGPNFKKPFSEYSLEEFNFLIESNIDRLVSYHATVLPIVKNSSAIQHHQHF